MYEYEGNNPVKYTVSHFDGVWASTMWILTGIDGPLPVGDIIYGIGITVELIGLAYAANKYSVQTFDNAIPQVKVNEEEKKLPTFIYRSGSGNGTNLTPRTPKDATGLSYTLSKPESGPYTVTTMEAVNGTGVLTAVKDGQNHVSVFPTDMSKMPEWQVSRDNANENPHIYTKLLQNISVKFKE